MPEDTTIEWDVHHCDEVAEVLRIERVGARDADGRVVLDYEPEIVDDDRCITSPRKNECVGCGNTQHLTRFYVVPYRFRRCFPEAFKQHSSHDVVALCLRCRDVVEPAYRSRSRALAFK